MTEAITLKAQKLLPLEIENLQVVASAEDVTVFSLNFGNSTSDVLDTVFNALQEVLGGSSELAFQKSIVSPQIDFKILSQVRQETLDVINDTLQEVYIALDSDNTQKNIEAVETNKQIRNAIMETLREYGIAVPTVTHKVNGQDEVIPLLPKNIELQTPILRADETVFGLRISELSKVLSTQVSKYNVSLKMRYLKENTLEVLNGIATKYGMDALTQLPQNRTEFTQITHNVIKTSVYGKVEILISKVRSGDVTTLNEDIVEILDILSAKEEQSTLDSVVITSLTSLQEFINVVRQDGSTPSAYEIIEKLNSLIVTKVELNKEHPSELKEDLAELVLISSILNLNAVPVQYPQDEEDDYEDEEDFDEEDDDDLF